MVWAFIKKLFSLLHKKCILFLILINFFCIGFLFFNINEYLLSGQKKILSSLLWDESELEILPLLTVERDKLCVIACADMPVVVKLYASQRVELESQWSDRPFYHRDENGWSRGLETHLLNASFLTGVPILAAIGMIWYTSTNAQLFGSKPPLIPDLPT